MFVLSSTRSNDVISSIIMVYYMSIPVHEYTIQTLIHYCCCYAYCNCVIVSKVQNCSGMFCVLLELYTVERLYFEIKTPLYNQGTFRTIGLVYMYKPIFLIRIPSSLPMVTTKRGTIIHVHVVTHDYPG